LNHIGWLVRNEFIDLEVIKETIRIVVIRVHENTRPLLDEYERRTNTRQRYTHLEYMYEKLKESHYQDLQEHQKQLQKTNNR
jgi:hypothetical protein